MVGWPVLEPAAHGMGAPQAFQNDLQMPTQKPDLGLKMVCVRHFSTSNRNGEKKSTLIMRRGIVQTIQCHDVEKISKISNVANYF